MSEKNSREETMTLNDGKAVKTNKLIYDVTTSPPWYLCILLGFQHYLTMFGSTVGVPLIILPHLCVGEDDVAKSEVLGTVIVVSGIITLLQVTFGCRLPIVQGGTAAFVAPTLAILSLPQWRCPAVAPVNSSLAETANRTFAPPVGTDAHRELWQSRMREIQGAIILSSLFQMFIGFSGMIGFLLRFIGPLTITPIITLIGLCLFDVVVDFCAKQWWISLMTIVFIVGFSQYMRGISVPCLPPPRDKITQRRQRLPIFQMFPVILGILLSWFVCYILTVADALPRMRGEWGHEARTDIRTHVIYEALWFRIPYPFQWGMPTVSLAGTIGMLGGVIPSIIESVGDYSSVARLSGAPPPPTHAINRGIGTEGLGCMLAGIWGTGNGTTSYGENIGAIGITNVGSRRVIQYAACLMILFGMLGKFGALFVTIPDPIMGGVFIIMYGMVAAVGLSNLQHVDLNSSRNLCILGLSFMMGLSVPNWMSRSENPIETGAALLDQVLTVLLSTSMFVGGFVGFVLDNTIPGTKEERGLIRIETNNDEDDSDSCRSCYDLPCGMNLIRKYAFTKYIPFSPTFVSNKTKS